MGKLTIVPTPVGNLEDMTYRAVRVLREADLILAEDTRTTLVLLRHYEIQNRLQSHHAFNEHRTAEELVERMQAHRPSPTPASCSSEPVWRRA